MGSIAFHVNTTPVAPDWSEAACKGIPVVVFIPDEDDYRRYTTADAKAICRRCPMRRACFEYAMADSRLVGVWGATTAKERAAERARRRREAAGDD